MALTKSIGTQRTGYTRTGIRPGTITRQVSRLTVSGTPGTEVAGTVLTTTATVPVLEVQVPPAVLAPLLETQQALAAPAVAPEAPRAALTDADLPPTVELPPNAERQQDLAITASEAKRLEGIPFPTGPTKPGDPWSPYKADGTFRVPIVTVVVPVPPANATIARDMKAFYEKYGLTYPWAALADEGAWGAAATADLGTAPLPGVR